MSVAFEKETEDISTESLVINILLIFVVVLIISPHSEGSEALFGYALGIILSLGFYSIIVIGIFLLFRGKKELTKKNLAVCFWLAFSIFLLGRYVIIPKANEMAMQRQQYGGYGPNDTLASGNGEAPNDKREQKKPWEEGYGQTSSLRPFDGKLDSVSTPQADSNAAAIAHYKKIYAAFPNAGEMIDSPEFKEWLRLLNPETHNRAIEIMKNGSADEVIDMLKGFNEWLVLLSKAESAPHPQSTRPVATQSSGWTPECEYKSAMTNEELKVCGINTSGQAR